MHDALTIRSPRPRFDVEVTLPGSKSIALRQLVMSAMASAPTTLDGIPRCDDIESMFGALERLSIGVSRTGKRAEITPGEPHGDVELDLGMSGVSLRFLIANAALRTTTTHITGHEQLHARPNQDLLDALVEIGCDVRSNNGRLPITIAGPHTPAERASLRVGVTSQYLSGLLLAAPAFANGLTIDLVDEQTSQSYIAVTTDEMAKRGVTVHIEPSAVVVPPQSYTGGSHTIEGDASAATYHLAMATLHGGTVRINNLGETTRQGDYAFLGLCERMGAEVERSADAITIRGPRELKPLGHVDMIDMPDAAQTVMAIAPFLPSPTHLEGLATLRVKECDRIACTATELRRAAIAVDEFPSAMTIHPIADGPRQTTFDTYEDHRMAMALSVLASRTPGTAIADPGCVSKTYTDYWDDFSLYA